MKLNLLAIAIMCIPSCTLPLYVYYMYCIEHMIMY